MSDDIIIPSRPTLFLTDPDVRAVFEWAGGVAALADSYAAPVSEAMFPPRAMARGDRVWLRTMTGVSPDGGVMGAKFIAAAMRSGCGAYLIPLFDQATAELVALLDANSITGFRTAATSALAADRLCAKAPLRLAVIGSGFEARNHVRALASLREIAHVAVFSPNPASRAAFIDALADLGIPMRAADSAEAALADATVILCAARSRDESPTLLGAWLRPGMTIVSIGSTLPEQREIDPEAVARADVIIADMVEEVLEDTGDMIAARAAGVDPAARIASLSDLVSGVHPGRTDDAQIILYKSVGAAQQDIAMADYCVKRAHALGMGTPLPVSISPVRKAKPAPARAD